MNEIQRDYEQQVKEWIEAERNGEQFPVDFEIAWEIAGYSNKANAKRQIKHLEEGTDFSSDVRKNALRGRPSDSISLTCDAFKHFCLMARTEQGREVRQYFIEVEKQWQAAKTSRPDLSDLSIETQAIYSLCDRAAHLEREQNKLRLKQEEQGMQIKSQEVCINYLMNQDAWLELERDTAHRRLAEMPKPVVAPIPKDSRAALNQLVRAYVMHTGVPFDEAWRFLYQEVYYRLHVDLKERARRRGKTRLEVAYEDGLIEQIYAIAHSLFTP